MTREIAKKIVKGITDKIECNTADIDDWAEFWGFTREEYEEFLDMAIKALEQEPTTKNDLGVDWDELKRKILMEVDGGTDDAWLAYGEVCDRISNSIDEFVADMREVKT